MSSSAKITTGEIILTGERRGDHYEVHLSGRPVGLTCSALSALVAMLVARGGTGTGFVQLSPVAVHRLRRAFDCAGGEGTGKTLIETGCGEEYRLTVPRGLLASWLRVDPSF